MSATRDTAASRIGSNRGMNRSATSIHFYGARAEGREERARNARAAAERLVREHRQGGDEHLAGGARFRTIGAGQGPSRRSRNRKRTPANRPRASSVGAAGGRAGTSSVRITAETANVAASTYRTLGVSRAAIRPPAAAGPSRAIIRGTPLKQRVAERDRALVVTEQLREDESLRREVRREEAADRRDEHEQQREP